MLRHSADAGQKRNLLAFHAVRITAPVPVLVQAADGLGGQLAHAEFGDDVGAAVAAHAGHLLIVPLLREADRKDARQLRRGAGARKNILPNLLQGRTIRLMRPGPVFESDPGLRGAVVSTDDLTQAACIAAAANVFEE